jgi:replicative DNA helicase
MVATSVERAMPHSIDAEQAVLGAMMIDREATAQVTTMLEPDDFYFEHHRIIYEIIRKLYERGASTDMVTVAEELRRLKLLDSIGGTRYISALVESCPATVSATDYARIVMEKSILRKLISTATSIANWAFEQEEDADTIIDRAEAAILSIGQRRLGCHYEPLQGLLKDAWERIERHYSLGGVLTGLPTGFRLLDYWTGGLHPSELIVVAARPGIGKTSFALCIALNVALREKQVVVIFSLEMSKQELIQRMLCTYALVNLHQMRRTSIQDEDLEKLARACEDLYSAPIYIVDSADLSPFEIRALSRRLKAERGLGLIIVDYLQLVRPPRKADTRAQEVGEIARSLKLLARELNVPVMALSQLSRAVEHRPGRRPMLADLRDSGAIEAEADVVIFLHREGDEEKSGRGKSKKEDSEKDQKEVVDIEVFIAKQRSGPTTSFTMKFDKRYTRFADVAPDMETPPQP